jgi:hypothetical protein
MKGAEQPVRLAGKEMVQKARKQKRSRHTKIKKTCVEISVNLLRNLVLEAVQSCASHTASFRFSDAVNV